MIKKISILDKYKEFVQECISNNIKTTEMFEELKIEEYIGYYETIINYIIYIESFIDK